MNSQWKSLGLKPQYETGELIVLVPQTSEEDILQKNNLFLSDSRSSKKIALLPKEGPGKKYFIEFYALEAGDYTLHAPWGSQNIEVSKRQGLGFQTEFGIFSIVVIAVILLMAKRYLTPSKANRRINHES